jgi:mannose-6-phosphate isomerase-like protein (cupin superfamily)
MPLFARSFTEPEEANRFPNGQEAVISVAGHPVGLATFEPGWRWSNDIRPLVGTDSCQVHHKAYIVSGHLHAEMTDGSSIDAGPGDVFEIPPGHDGWVVGDEPCVMLDWGERVRAYAKPAGEMAGGSR